jgi:hypothetical protein
VGEALGAVAAVGVGGHREWKQVHTESLVGVFCVVIKRAVAPMDV